MTTHDEVAHAMAAAWSAAASPWNPQALTALYQNDAVFFGGRPGHSRGRREILAYFESYRGVIASCRLTLHDLAVLAIGSEVLLVQGFADMRFVLAGDKASASELRATWMLAREVDGWRIKQHHFSPAPAAPPLGN